MSPPTRTRAAGLAATVLLALAAAHAGALPGGDPAPALRSGWSAPPSYWWGLAAWLAGTVLLSAVWWRASGLTVRYVLVTGSLWAVPLLLAPPLASRDVYAYACQGATLLSGHDPYAVGPAGAGCPWLAAVPEIWRDSTTPYGPLAVAVSAGTAQVAEGRLWLAVAAARVAALCGLALVAYFGVRLARACGVDPSRALWAGLVTPVVLLHAVSGAHNDALVAGLVIAALALAVPAARPVHAAQAPPAAAPGPSARPHDPAAGPHDAGAAPGVAGPRGVAARPAVGTGAALAAGALAAAAIAIKVTAIVALPFVLILLGRRRLAGLAAALAAFAALTWGTGLGLGWVRALAGTQELTQWSSVPTGVGMAVGYLLRALGRSAAEPAAISAARALGVAALAVIGAVALVRAWRADGPGPAVAACGWVMAATALLGPVFYPWYAVAPLAVLACAPSGFARTRAAVTVGLALLILPQGLGLPSLTKGPGAVAVLIGVVWVCWAGLRRASSTARA